MRSDAMEIIDKVCSVLSVTKEEILSKKRTTDVVEARFICVYLIRMHVSDITLITIGQWFGKKNNGNAHSFVLYAMKKIEIFMQTDRLFANKYKLCESHYKEKMFVNIPQF